MILPVYIPQRQIGDGDIAPPAVGQQLDHVLILDTPGGRQQAFYGRLGREVSLEGTAVPLSGYQGGASGSHPTELRCEGFSVYWPAPQRVSGALSMAGILHSDSYSTAPEGFPRVQGTITAVAQTSFQYATADMSYVPGFVVEIDTSVVDRPAAVLRARFDGRTTVRIFPDYAKTVLWFLGPLLYKESEISPALASAMQDWEASYYSSLTPDDAWISPEAAAAFTATGNELAQRLADELGEMFAVEFHSYEPGTPRRTFGSDSAATNPAAAGALTSLVAADAAEKERLAALPTMRNGGP